MSIEESDATLVGLDWETWQCVTQTRGLAAAAGTNYDAAAMPSQKAVCYGFYPSIELESMLLINCKKCGLILKDVGYGHHMRSQHGYHISSGSGDECQSFLLSPPHRVVSPRLEMPILSPPYRRLSTSIASPKESSGRNGSIITQATSTRYSVEQKDDLKLSLRVSRHEVSNEASGQNNLTLSNGSEDELRICAKINRRLNGKMKDKKGKKRRRDSSDEDNFSLEHFRQKKRLSKKEQNVGKANDSASSNIIRHDNTDDGHIDNDIAAASQSTKTSTETNRVPAKTVVESASVSTLLPTDKKVQPEIALKSIGNIERLQKEHEEICDVKEQMELSANYSGQWNEVDSDAYCTDLSHDVTTCPTLKSEKIEAQQIWTPNAILSLEDSGNESHPCEDSDPHRFYVPSPPQLSPVAEKECYMDPVTTPITTDHENIYHDHHVEENLLLQPHERLIHNGYREVLDLSRPSSLHPNDDLDLNEYGTVRHRCVVLEQNEEDADTSRGSIATRYPIEERIVATGPCFYGYPLSEVSEDVRSRRLPRSEEGYMGNEIDHKTHTAVEQKMCLPHQQLRCPQLVSVSFVPQKRSSRTCSSPTMEGFCTGGVSYRDVYIDPEQKIYYPNARLLTVPINGKTTVDYPPQTRSSPPDIFSTEQNIGLHDLPDDVERLPQLPSFHNNMVEGMQREMRDSAQLKVINQESQQRFDQIDYNVRSERSQLSSGRNSVMKIANEAMSERPYDYSPVTSINLHGTRSSNYVPHVTRKKGFAPRVIRTVRSHVDTTQQPATSQVTPHEVCVPIHGRTVIRPEYRYVYIPSKSPHSADLDHIYNRQRKDREREMNEFNCTEVRHVEHHSRVEPTIRQVAIQKVQPTVLNRVRPLTTTNAEGVRTVKMPAHRRLGHQHPSSGTEKTLVFQPELKNERNSYSSTSVADVVRINSRDRMYQECGYAAPGNIQRGANVANKSKQHSNFTSSYQIQQNAASRQVRRTKVTPPADDMESRFGADDVGSHLLNSGMVRDCTSFALSMENRPNVPHGIIVQTTQLRNTCTAGTLSGNRLTVTIFPVPDKLCWSWVKCNGTGVYRSYDKNRYQPCKHRTELMLKQMKLVKLWMFGMIEILTAVLLLGILYLPANGNLQEYGHKQGHDSAEGYDADGDLSVPIDAQGRPYQFNSSKIDSEANRKRKNAPARYEDERSFCYCNYAPEFCGGFTNFTCIKHLEASCFHFTEEIYDKTSKQIETMHLFGCAPLTRGSGGSYFTCKAYLVAHAQPKSIACCQEGNYCNRNLSVPTYANVSPEGVIVDYYAPYMTVTAIVYAVLFSILAGIALFLVWRRNFIAEKLKPSLQKSTRQMTYTAEIEKAPMLYDVSSGSGSGFASLNQRTVAQDLEFLSVVGKGRYGEVKKARYRGDRIVAVKTFYTTEEDSWKNEKEIYQTQMLNHENILQFVAADIGSEDSITRMLLITDFHAYGSLFEYLQRGETLSISEALHLAYSAVCGLEHLHNALHGTGTPQKPAIAHRDVKSKNIIVKRPYVCCIADFGLALTEDMVKARVGINIQVGTKRYMAPEVLEKSLNVKNFHHFKMADIYSFALVIWEILRRIQEDNCLSRASESDSGIGSSGSGSGTTKLMPGFIANPDVLGYITSVSNNVVDHQSISENSMSLKAGPPMQPFDGMVDPDPSFEQMRRLVCLEGKRPLLEDSWIRDPCLKEICELIEECWSASIDCRHTALRVKRKIKDTILKHNGLGGIQTSGSNKHDCSAKALSV